jgi:hypothetical protein
VGHPYIVFRTRLAHFALMQFAASLKSSSEILAFVFGPMLLGLLACLALPPMYASTLAPLPACALIGAHGMLMALPVWLLRKRMLPGDVRQWLHALPLPARTKWLADAAVAGIMAGPLALAYLASAGVWLYEAPAWLHRALGITATLASTLLTWACATAILALRARADAPSRRLPRAATGTAAGYVVRRPSQHAFFLWRRLFWLPFWRAENVVGLQQTLMLLLALACAVAWMIPPPDLAGSLARGLAGVGTSVLLVLMADRGDKAVREQVTLLRGVMAAWPTRLDTLVRYARLFCLAPGALLLCVLFAAGLRHDAWSHKAGQAYLALAALSQLALVSFPNFSPRGRVSLVVLSMLVLTAVGSELWH